MTPPRVLIIDDEPDFGALVERVAIGLGFEAKFTTRAREFQDAVGCFRPDVIVLDIVMPDMDGIELIRWLRGVDCRARVIVASGYNPAYTHMAQVLGSRGEDGRALAVTTLNKPVRIADLRAALLDAATPAGSNGNV